MGEGEGERGRGGGRTAPQLPQVLLEPSDEAPHLGQAVPCMLGKVLLSCSSCARVCVRGGLWYQALS